MNNCCDSYCHGCQYYSTYLKNCDYSELEGTLRGCPPGRECTRKKKCRKKTVKNPLGIKRSVKGLKKYADVKAAKPEKPNEEPKKEPKKPVLKEFPERMERYLAGMNATEMAKAEGCSLANICAWLRRRNLPVNKTKRKVKNGET